jgi:hypothetical protein
LSAVEEPDCDLSPLGSLALLWPAIPEALIGPAERLRIEAAAARLAPVARVALELRLGDGRDQVDLHQFISRSPADAAALRRHLSRLGPPQPGEGPVRRFLGAWAEDSGGLRTDLDGFFLEWDGPGSNPARPPAIFLPVEDRADRVSGSAERRQRVAGHIAHSDLAGGEVGALLAGIAPDVSIAYVGFMLGRGDVVRLNLRSVRPDGLAAVLAGLRWPGDMAHAASLFSRLVDLTGHVTLALDFDPAIRPTLGFECALPHFPGEEPRWGALFDSLCADGLCTGEKRSALERVGARLYPEDAGQDWPASWIAAALRAPPQWVPWFERRLSHVKVSIGAEGDVSAKAYVSAQHHWSREVDPPRRRTDAAPRRSAAGEIRAAAVRAARFLVAARQQDDLWRDFQVANGESDEWVTALVGLALSASGVPLPDGLMAQTVRALLRRQRPEGGWGYNRISPADSDSTAWVLKFLAAAGHSGPEPGRAKAFLLSHLRPGGAFSTYAEGTSLRFGGGPGIDDSGWRGGHLCVAANAAGLIGAPLVGHLLSSQSPDGAWPAYWWRGDALSTALAAESLAGVEAASASRSRAAEWALRRSETARTPFERAWLVRILCAAGPAERSKAGAMALALAAGQSPDGGWDSSADLLVPHPAQVSRADDSPVFPDQRRLFTAASVLLALGSAPSASPVQ